MVAEYMAVAANIFFVVGLILVREIPPVGLWNTISSNDVILYETRGLKNIAESISSAKQRDWALKKQIKNNN
jgi:hypothetical protein